MPTAAEKTAPTTMKMEPTAAAHAHAAPLVIPVVKAPTSKYKKVPNKPKRPLSAFNLFYRYKRQKTLDAIATGKLDKDGITKLVEASPGLEHMSEEESKALSTQELAELRRKNIRADLVNNLLPRDTRDRAHRTNSSAMNGSMSFLELGQLMNVAWKNCDEFARGVYKELAEEGREQYRQRLKDFNDLKEKEAKNQPPAQQPQLVMNVNSQYTNVPPLAVAAAGGKGKKRKGGKSSTSPALMSEIGQANMHQGQLAVPLAMHPGAMGMPPLGHPMPHMMPQYPGGPQHPTHHPAPAFSGIPTSSLIDLLAKRGDLNNALRTVSSDQEGREQNAATNGGGTQSPAESGTGGPPQGHLMARVKDLETQLQFERLHARIRDLENELARSRGSENQLRGQLSMYRQNDLVARGGSLAVGGLAPPLPPPHGGAPGAHALAGALRGQQARPSSGAGGQGVAPQDGLWSLVNASMIHPSQGAGMRGGPPRASSDPERLRHEMEMKANAAVDAAVAATEVKSSKGEPSKSTTNPKKKQRVVESKV